MSERSQTLDEQWNAAAGNRCPKCGKNALRFQDGMCWACYQRNCREQARDEEHISMALTYSVNVPPKRKRPSGGR